MKHIYTNVAAWLIAGAVLQNAYLAVAGILLNAIVGVKDLQKQKP